MSDPVTNSEIEDVLSSIRRLVSTDDRPAKAQASDKAVEEDKLVLTPSLRVDETADIAPSETDTQNQTASPSADQSEDKVEDAASADEKPKPKEPEFELMDDILLEYPEFEPPPAPKKDEDEASDEPPGPIEIKTDGTSEPELKQELAEAAPAAFEVQKAAPVFFEKPVAEENQKIPAPSTEPELGEETEPQNLDAALSDAATEEVAASETELKPFEPGVDAFVMRKADAQLDETTAEDLDAQNTEPEAEITAIEEGATSDTEPDAPAMDAFITRRTDVEPSETKADDLDAESSASETEETATEEGATSDAEPEADAPAMDAFITRRAHALPNETTADDLGAPGAKPEVDNTETDEVATSEVDPETESPALDAFITRRIHAVPHETTVDDVNAQTTAPDAEEIAAEISEAPEIEPEPAETGIEEIAAQAEDSAPNDMASEDDSAEETEQDDAANAPVELSSLTARAAVFERAVADREDHWEPDGTVANDNEAQPTHALPWQDEAEDSDAETPEELPRTADAAQAAEGFAPFVPENDENDDIVEDADEEEAVEAPADETRGNAFLTEEDLLDDEETAILDEEALRDLVSEIVRQELQGSLGERITRNVRKLVRREIQRALTAQKLE